MARCTEADKQIVYEGGHRWCVEHAVMSVREVALQDSTAASLALLDPAGSYLYVPALGMGEITGLTE